MYWTGDGLWPKKRRFGWTGRRRELLLKVTTWAKQVPGLNLSSSSAPPDTPEQPTVEATGNQVAAGREEEGKWE